MSSKAVNDGAAHNGRDCALTGIPCTLQFFSRNVHLHKKTLQQMIHMTQGMYWHVPYLLSSFLFFFCTSEHCVWNPHLVSSLSYQVATGWRMHRKPYISLFTSEWGLMVHLERPLLTLMPWKISSMSLCTTPSGRFPTNAVKGGSVGIGLDGLP